MYDRTGEEEGKEISHARLSVSILTFELLDLHLDCYTFMDRDHSLSLVSG